MVVEVVAGFVALVVVLLLVGYLDTGAKAPPSRSDRRERVGRGYSVHKSGALV